MGKMQRNKGAAAEREVAEMFRLWGWPLASRRASGEESQQQRGIDIKGTAPYVVQVQHAATTTPDKKLREAEDAAEDGQMPIAFVKRNRGTWMVCMAAKDFFALARKGAWMGES